MFYVVLVNDSVTKTRLKDNTAMRVDTMFKVLLKLYRYTQNPMGVIKIRHTTLFET